MRLALLALTASACGRIGFGELADSSSAAPTPGFVQATTVDNIASGGSTTATVSFLNPIAAGDTILAYCWTWGEPDTGTSDVTDDHDNTYSLAKEGDGGVSMCGGSTATALVYYATVPATPAGLTITFAPVGGTEFGVFAVDYSGLAGVVEDTSAATTAAMNSPQTFTSGAVTTTSAHALVASLGVPCAGYPDSLTWTDDTSFTVRGVTTETNLNQPALGADELVTPGTYSDEWTISFNNSNIGPAVGVIAAFR